MKIDLSCPVELWHFKMPTAEYPVVSLHMFNLSEKPVVSIQAAFLSFDEEGEQTQRQVERVQGLLGEAHSAFEVLVAVEDGEKAASLDFIIEKVWFSDGTVWRRGAGEMSEYQDNRLAPSRQLDVLRQLAGEDALGYPSDQGAVWVCVCGRPNGSNASQCLRCGREKYAQFTRFNKAAVETVIFRLDSEMEEKARAAREEAGRMQEAREKKEQQRRKRAKRTLITLISAAVLLAGAYLVYFHGIPAYNYYQAEQALTRGDYDQAKAGFQRLLDYRDASAMALEADYRRAGELAQTATVTSLRSAETLYASLAGYQDSGERFQQSKHTRASLLLEAGSFEEALALFEELGDYGDSREMALETQYLWARALMEGLDYTAAREKLLALGDYQDAARLAEDSLFLPALSHLEKKEYALAEGLLSQLSGRQNAELKLKEVYYGWGDQLFSAGDYDLAAEKFLLAGDYLDAFRRASECLYEPAILLLQQGALAEAKEKFDQILAYRDSAILSQEASYRMGLKEQEAGDWALAVRYFEDAPDIPGSALAMQQSSYNLALAAQAQGELQQAADLFLQAGDYQDAPELAPKARFDLGIALSNQRDYLGAAEAFGMIPDYPGAGEELRRAEYNRGIALLEAGEVQAAIDQFVALGQYERSEDYLKQALYAKATQLLEAGEQEQAMSLFRQLGDYEDAGAQWQEAVYQKALALLNDSDTAGAVLQLEEIQGYKNAEELYQNAVYTQAKASQEAGDYGAAARLYAQIPQHEDAAALGEASYDAYYEEAYTIAQAAMKDKDYKTAIDALEDLDRENTGEKYADVEDIYKEATYQYANALYNDDKPYEALVYYRKILDYKDVSSRRLDRASYRVLGTWQTEKGAVFIFRDDGSCVIEGKEMFFSAKNFTLLAGDRPGELNINYHIVDSREKRMTLRHTPTKKLYKFTRVTQEEP